MPRLNQGEYEQPPRSNNRISSNAGLWLDKYLVTNVDGGVSEGAKATLVRQASEIPVGAAYARYYAHVQQELGTLGAIGRRAEVIGAMVIGLGNASIIETGITLHRTYGVPMIPGSALKGLASTYAEHYLGDAWEKQGDAYRTLFGYVNSGGGPNGANGSAGYVTFCDALYIPNSAEGNQPLCPDVMVPHHPKYYSGEPLPPADYDDPNPVNFAAARGAYMVRLIGDEAWVNAAFEMLAHALQKLGVGGKTTSGYGRMKMAGYESLWVGAPTAVPETGMGAGPVPPDDPVEPEYARARELLRMHFLDRLAPLRRNDIAGRIGGYRAQIRNLPIQETYKKALQREAAKAVVDKIAALGKTADFANRTDYRALVAIAEGTLEA